jgi:hypothetical protein
MALAWLLLCALLLGGVPPGGANAQAQGAAAIQLDVNAGFGDSGAYVIGEWVPVRITLTNPPGGAARRVTVEVEAYAGDDRSVIGLFNREVDLPGQSRKELTLYTYTGGYSRAFRVYVRDGNNLLVTKSASVVPFESPSNVIVGVASSDSSLLNALGSERIGHIVGSLAPGMGQYGYQGPTTSGPATAILAHVDLVDLPPAYQGWKALSVLLLDDVDAASLSLEQRAALETWVAEGGTLIVAWRPGGGDSTVALSALLPVTVSGARPPGSLESLGAYVGEGSTPAGEAQVGQAALNSASADTSRVLARDSGSVLLASRDVGRGRVIYMGASPALPPLKSWDGTVPLMKKLLADTPVRPSFGAYMRVGPMRGVYIGSVYGTYGSMFAMPGLDLPNAWLVGGFLLIYILIIGPLNFIVLRRMRRAELAWITVPALVGLFSVGAYILAYQAKGGEVVSIRAGAVNTHEDVAYATTTQYFGLFSPVRRSYRLSMPVEATVTELGAYGNYQAGSENPVHVTSGNATVLDDVLVNTWSLKAFMTEHANSIERPVEADLRLENGMIVGNVTNRLNTPLQDVALVRGDATHYVGFVAAGGSAEVKLALSHNVFNNSSPAALLPPPPGVAAPQPGFGYPNYGTQMSAEQRVYNRKIELMSAGLYPYFGDNAPTDYRVTILAWGPAAPDPFAIERYTSRLEEATLWVTQATVRAGHARDAPIQSGGVPYSVYAPGNSIAWITSGSGAANVMTLAPGQAVPIPRPTVTMQMLSGRLTIEPYADIRYSLPAGTEARTLRLDYALSSSTLSAVETLVYNTRTGAWDQVGAIGDIGQGGTKFVRMALPDAAPYVGPAGDLTVRIIPASSGGGDLTDPVFDIVVNPDEEQR